MDIPGTTMKAILTTFIVVVLSVSPNGANECDAPPEMSAQNFQRWKIMDFDKFGGTNMEVTYRNGSLKVSCVYDTWTVLDGNHIKGESAPKQGASVDWRVTLVRESRTQFAFENKPSVKEWVVGFIPGRVLLMMKCVRPDLVQVYTTFTNQGSDNDFRSVVKYLNDNVPQMKKLEADFRMCSATN